ncbi:MAG: signal recognition particle protein, partial [Clostridiaceae bacterium]|nr:signal recognition particle protein [Clostridiaceae bacterium]
MVFEGLSEKLQSVIKKIRGAGRVTEKDVKAMMREVKLALLEADVNFKVVKDFIAKVSERAVGQDVLDSLTPGQQVVKIVHEELISLMGGKTENISFSSAPPSVYMMAGLQGSGKTTTAAKLANFLKKRGKRPMLAACDLYRP